MAQTECGTAEQRAAVLQRLADGISVSAVARAFGTSRQTVLPGPLAFLPVASLMFQQRSVYHADVVVIGKQVAMQHQPGAASAGDRLRPKG